MARVDQRYEELALRVKAINGDIDGATGVDIFILGGCFTAAWLTGSEMRAGKIISPYDAKEYTYVKDALERIGWLDLLDE